MRINGRMAGFVGFDWILKSEAYSSTITLLLQVLGVIFANALERQKEERDKERLIEELQETQEELLTLSIRDQLTGLFNRRHMEESLKREVSRAKRHESSLAIIMLDVDHFKNINDMYGHMAGDVVLQKIGEFLLEHSRGEDVVCRFGGEEFVLIMPGATKESGEKRANELCVAIREDVQISYRKTTLPPITVSIGVSVYPDHGKSSDEMIFEADIALYKAKEGGRNRAEVASKIAGV
nr:GGDEF domain-containing protein [Desulfobulbaceae bacterium]